MDRLLNKYVLTKSVHIRAIASLCLFICAVSQANAATYNYLDEPASSISIGSSTQCTGTPISRTISVTDSYIIGDLNFGFIASHDRRGQVEVTITSPSSTSVTVINAIGGNDNNYNVLLDSASGTSLDDGLAHNTATTPYQYTRAPSSTLNAFNGETSNGTWTIEVCDNKSNNGVGNYIRSELEITDAPPRADLSLVVSANDTTPEFGTNVVLTYTVNNSASSIATDSVTASITLPSGLSYVSDNGGTEYNSGSGLWTIPGSIAGGASESLQITAYVEASGPYVTTAEIETSSQIDPDSTPGNGNASEDDYDTLTLAPVTAPVPPLSCPGAASVVDWDVQSWPTGTTDNTYTVDGEDVRLVVTAAAGVLLNSAGFGGQSPAEQTTFTGGYTPVQSNVGILADQPSQASTVDVDLSLGTAGTGVSKFQLTLFDVDFGTAQFQDRIIIAGSLGGSSVSATYITGTSYTMSGDVATGTVASGSNLGSGNLTIMFTSPVDTVNISYGNGPGAPADPGQQGIGIHDIYFCPPIPPAILTAVKTTEVYDPLSEGLYAIPGNDVIYSIDFTNSGDGDADLDSVVIIDSLPPEIEFYNGDIDDGGSQTNPVIGIDNGSGLSLDYANDVKFSKAATKPANFAACTDSLIAGYDPDVNFICLNPSGTMAAGDPDPSFQIQFRARIK